MDKAAAAVGAQQVARRRRDASVEDSEAATKALAAVVSGVVRIGLQHGSVGERQVELQGKATGYWAVLRGG